MNIEVLSVFEKPCHSISSPKDSLPLFTEFYSLNKISQFQEIFSVMTLDSSLKVIGIYFVTLGTLNSSIVHPRDVFAKAISDHASAIIISHNHPSGNTSPSKQDNSTTKTLLMASHVFGIQLLDHVIFSSSDYFSYLENDLLSSYEESPDFKNLLKVLR